MKDCGGFGIKILDGLEALGIKPVYKWLEGFSVLELAVNGEDGGIEAYRITIDSLPSIFAQTEN